MKTRDGHVKRFLYEVVTRIMPLVAGRAFRDDAIINRIMLSGWAGERATHPPYTTTPCLASSRTPVPPSRHKTFLIYRIGWPRSEMGSPSSYQWRPLPFGRVTRFAKDYAARRRRATKLIMLTIGCIEFCRDSDILQQSKASCRRVE